MPSPFVLLSYLLYFKKTYAMARINDIIEIEGKLLRLRESHRNDLTLNQNIILSSLLRSIGEITDLYFSLQGDYYKLHGKEMLKEYHERLASEDIMYDTGPAEMFIESAMDTIGESGI